MKAAVPDIKVGNNSKIRDLSYPVAELMTWSNVRSHMKQGSRG